MPLERLSETKGVSPERRLKVSKKLKDVWDYVGGNEKLDDVVKVARGELGGNNRPIGECWVCDKFLQVKINESPQTAKCCVGCDAYQGTDGGRND